MGKSIAFVSVKGGVGKTSVALETAAVLANSFDKRVLLVDGNFSAPNIGLYLDLTEPDVTLHDSLLGIGLHNAIYEAHGFDVVPASLEYGHDVDVFRLKRVLARVKQRYDFIIIDSSPNYEEMVPVIAAADKVFVVTSPDVVTLTTSLKSARIAKRSKTPIEGIVINRIRNPKYELTLEEVEEASDIPVVARIKDDKRMVEAMHLKTPISLHKPRSPVAEEVRRFGAALCGLAEEQENFWQRILPFRDVIGKEKVNRELLRKEFYESVL